MSPELRKLEAALSQIKKTLNTKDTKIFSRKQIEEILSYNRQAWDLNKKTTVKTFIEFLIETDTLEEAIFDFPTRKEVRFIFGDASNFELAQSLKPSAYLTHSTAMYLHELTKQPPDPVYINQEQPKPHNRNSGLIQENIDKAFKNRSRVSHDIAEYKGVRVCILHGQKTSGLGVIKMTGRKGELLQVTSLERTLIDIAVRPVYSGGVSEVLKAYRLARSKVSIEKLVATLNTMNFVYPYHQAIGFYLERTGLYTSSELQQFSEIPMEFNFYLEYSIKDSDYSDKWRLYFPRGL